MENIRVYDNFIDPFTSNSEPDIPIHACLTAGVDIIKHRSNPLILEFGVASGRTMRSICERGKFDKTNSRIFGFDSFHGLPEKWRDGYHKGAFTSFGNAPPDLSEKATLYQGLFAETIPHFVKNVMKNVVEIDLIHVDCDLYSSTKTIFEHLAQYIGPNTVIVFDELFNYPGWEDHEWKALTEFLQETNRAIATTSFMIKGQEQALIQVT